MKDIWRKVITVLLGIVLNVCGGCVASVLNLPIWLNTVGTFCGTYYVGIAGGVIVSLVSSLILWLFKTDVIVYLVVSLIATIVMHIFIKRSYANSIVKAIMSGFWLGVICTVVSVILNLIRNDGYCGNIWGDTLVDMLRWHEVSYYLSAIAGQAIVEIVDKQFCIIAAFGLIQIGKRMKAKSSPSSQTVALLLAAGMATALVAMPLKVQAVPALQDEYFVQTIYNNTNGMVSSEANAICETDDGYIWIGSYAGLSRYDGSEFEFIREGGLVNVAGMMTDSHGRLWIGTNDAGIARYENGKYRYFTKEQGLVSNSIRCFAEDENGNVYVGTSDKICRFHADDTIEILNHDITFAKTMIVHDKKLVVIDNKGGLYALDGDKSLSVVNNGLKNHYYSSLASTTKGLMVGTDTGELYVFDVSASGLVQRERIDLSANGITAIFEDSKNRIWIATGSSLGYIDQNNNYQRMYYEGFDSSFVDLHEDYQGNIWVASSRYGVMELSESAFVNLFEKAGVERSVVNAVVFYNDDYYCGTDKGLIILDGTNLSSKTNELTTMTEGCRIRSFFVDSQRQLWICTYNGLICYDAAGEIYCYNAEADKVTSDRFRCITELTDKTLVAGTADGINFIKSGKVVDTLTADDGLANTQILSIVEGKDGTVLAGSDGSGIYLISEGQLVENYTVDNGLSSNVILRIVPYGNGYFIVTSNALCYMDGKCNIRKLSHFPYFNNYDIIIEGEKAYITCSAGMYETEVSKLLQDSDKQPRFYGASEGLLSGLTANSWNYVSEKGQLFLCSNNGVIVFHEIRDNTDAVIKSGIFSVECDGAKLEPFDNNSFVVPANAKNLSIYASVRNYSFTDVMVRFYVKEIEDNPKIYSWDEIEPIRIYKPDIPEYNICLQILDSSGEKVLQEQIFTLTKETQMWEKPIYQVYLVLACLEIFIVTIISIVSMILFIVRKNELEKRQLELEKKVDEQTGELKAKQQTIKELFLQTVTALSEAVDAKDRYTSGHSKRVAGYACMIAARMGKSKEEQEEIYRAGLLHDVGKIRIPVDIINKPGKLTDEEFNIIKIHPVTGYHILRGITGSNMIALGSKYHHERYDGKGYPNGLAGNNIPEVARILGVADSYDAMTSNRSYRKALPQEVVRSEIEKGRGTQFDPQIADIMLQMIDEDKDYQMRQEEDTHRKVLVIDDQEMNHKLIKHIMNEEPMYEIVSAYGGKEALKLLAEDTFDLILLDVMMPEMDGLETLRCIRQKYQTPVALMTGDKELDLSGEFAELGCDDYITKPFLPLLIKEIIHNMTERTTIVN